MPKLDDVAYYYHGDEGEYLLGVPARDLTHLDMESLDLLQRRDVMHATVPRGDKVMPLYSTIAKVSDTVPVPKWFAKYQKDAAADGMAIAPVIVGESKAAYDARMAELADILANADPNAPNESVPAQSGQDAPPPAEGEKG